jgi:hypothetical protein
MRAVGFIVAVVLTAAGCSVLFNGNDLKGHGDGGAGTGGTGGGGGTGGTGGGGGRATARR